jgi:hypothetical protein
VLRSVTDEEPPGPPPGRYLVRAETRLGVPVAAIYWAAPGEPRTLVLVLARDRLRLLAEALAEYLAAGEPPR